jgi:hypothetical protein
MRLILPLGLAAASAMLACVLVFEIAAPVQEPEIPPAPPRAVGGTSAVPAPFAPPGEEEFAVINQRSAFIPSRLAVEEPAVSDGAASPPDFTLAGVIVSARKSIAILRAPGAQVSTNVTVGQMIGGWRIVRIQADKIVLNANGSDYEIRLRPAAGGEPE